MRIKLKSINSRGLTLVELLVSVAIIVILMTVVVSIMFTTLRTTSKSNISEDIRQSGNSALTQITKQVQFADSFDGSIPVDEQPESDTDCTTDNNIKYSQVSFTKNEESHSLVCYDEIDTGTSVLRLDDKDIIDSSKAVLSSCSMTCTQASVNDSPVIGLNFTLSNLSSDASEKKETINFAKSIKMRANQ